MLLRSLTKHVRDQNWFAVFLDFFIVVAGILIAFQITNWNEARKDQVLETRYLERIYFDMARSIEGAEGDTSWTEERLRTQETVLNSLRSELLTDENKKDFERGLIFFGYVQQRDRNWQTIQELQATGRMSIIKDSSLRDLIGRLEEEYESRTQRHHSNREERVNYKVLISDRWEFVDAEFRTGGDQTINYDFDDLVRDNEFLYRLSHMHAITQLLIADKERDLAGFRELRDAVVEVLGYVPDEGLSQRKSQ